MKKHYLILLSLFALILSACNFVGDISSSIISSSTTSSITTTTTTTSISVNTTPKLIDLYALNDFHGHIQEDEINFIPGLARLQTYLKNQKATNPDGFVFLSSGDTFQETYDSSINKGEFMAKCLPLMEAETMTLGNHEFDWGLEVLKENRQFAGSTTFLAANLYEYDETNDTVGDFANDLASQYKIIERDGVKIGIIGVIGYDQITSITSSIWEGLTFLEPTEIVKQLSDELKGEYDCDLVVVSAHASYDDLGIYFANEVTSVSPITNKRYIDCCFTAHSHGYDNINKNGVPFVQGGSKGSNVSHVSIQVFEDGTSSVLTVEQPPITMSLPKDSQMQSYIDSYFNEDFYKEKNAVIGNIVDASYLARGISGNLLNIATYYELEQNNIEVDVIMNNGGRNSVNLLDDGGVSIGVIYDALPFLNKTIISEVKGSDILNEARYNYYFAPQEITIDPNEYYTLAAIDYLMLHKNSNRQYDYFPSYSGINSYVIEDVSYELVRNYFLENQSITISQLNNDPGFSNITNV